MKLIAASLLTIALASQSFAQTNVSFESQPVEVQAQMVVAAQAELASLDQQLAKAKSLKKVALIVGITAATAATAGALYAGFKYYKAKGITITPETAKLIRRGAYVAVGAAAAGALISYLSFDFYEIKSEEIDKLRSEIQKAQIALGAADRTYRLILGDNG
ncbi:MAG TPA: hypothetical protein VFV50_12195 [Bdellovibrionales bacterium]|nr:hypothetical protein [Bdellovibrionales bacterium]